IRTAWLRYQVLFFREQTMAPEELLALGRRFGDIQEQGYAPGRPGTPGVWAQEYPDMYRMPVSDIDWHADGSFRPNPTRGSLLMASGRQCSVERFHELDEVMLPHRGAGVGAVTDGVGPFR